MAHYRHFAILMWKNWLLKKRNWGSSLCEILLPIIFTAIMVLIFFQFDTNFVADTQFVGAAEVKRIYPYNVVPFRLQLANQKLAIVGTTPALNALVDTFVQDMDQRYPAMNGSSIGNGKGFISGPLRALQIPTFSSTVMRFESEAALESYVKAKAYNTDPTLSLIWGAVIFYKGPPNWDYAIRMNGTQVYNTRQSAVDTLQRGSDDSSLKKYQVTTPTGVVNPFARSNSNANPVLTQSFPGFMSLQLAIDRWILNTTVPVASMDPMQSLQFLGQAMSFCVTPAQAGLFLRDLNILNATDQPRYLGLVNELVKYIGESERYVPQQVTVVPFPITSYQSNNFYPTVLPTFAFFFVITFLFPVSRLIRGIVMEKEMKLREGMKQMGLSDAALFGSWLATYIILYCFLAILVTIITAQNIFRYSSSGVVFFVFFLFGLSSTTYSYLISVFFSRAKTASTLGIVLFLGGYFPFFAVQPSDISMGAKLGGAFFAPTAFGLALDLIGTFEDNGAGINSSNINSVVNNWSVGASIALMIVDTILYSVIAWYADNVLPAKYREFGVPRPYNFPFTVSYWREVLNLPPLQGTEKASSPLLTSSSSNTTSKGVASFTNGNTTTTTNNGILARLVSLFRAGGATSTTTNVLPSATAAYISRDGRRHNGPPTDASFVEEPDSELRAKDAANRTVHIRKLRKEFDTPDGIKVAVDDLDLTMYEGQILVLLGHNGAGKTTTISMMTGLTQPTDGSMVVFGRDVGSHLSEVRKELGVCPQHDVLWPELTVEEHLQIFAAIKEVPKDKIQAEINKALKDVGLTEKLKYKSHSLSGGQKRKLSVCIALVGGSKVIFLDEPTSGMDPYSRRSTWQILQNAREGRVMVLTTHFMDEADILGDRIAIMANGQLKCAGSPMFLKNKYGIGYILTIVKQPKCDSEKLIQLVQRYVPEATVGTDVGAELSMRLPLSSSSAFPALLGELDNGLEKLRVVTYGVSASDIQDVFLRIAGGDHHGAPTNDTLLHDGPAKDISSSYSSSSSPAISTASNATASVSPENVLSSVDALADTVANGGIFKNPSATSSSAYSKSGVDAVRAEARAVQTGFATFGRHFYALLLKRWQFTKRDPKALCYQLLIPVVMTLGGLALLKAGIPLDYPDYQLSTAQLNAGGIRVGDPNKPNYPNYVTAMSYKSSDPSNGLITSSYVESILGSFQSPNATTTEARLRFTPTQAAGMDSLDTYSFISPTATYPTKDWQRMSSFLLRDKASYAASKFGAYVFTRDNSLVSLQDAAITVPGGNAATYSVLVNTTAKHGAPLFMNLMNTALYRQITGNTDASITTRTHPLPFTLRQSNLIGAFFSFSAAVIIVMAYAFIPASYAIFVVKEREVSAKHQQLISGVSIPAYWCATYFFDAMTYIIPAGLSILLTKLFDIREFSDTASSRINGLILLFWLYGMSVAPFTYCLTYLFKSHSTAQNVVLFTNVTCMILMIASLIMSQVESTCRADEYLRYVYRLLPGFSLGNGLIQLSFLSQLALLDATCDRYHGVIRPASSYVDYDALDWKAVGTNCAFMAVESVVYFAIAILIDIALSHPRLRLWCGRDPVLQDKPLEDEDEDIVAERNRVKAELARLYKKIGDGSSGENGTSAGAGAEEEEGHATHGEDVVLLDSLRKVYRGPTGGGKVAVRGLSYGIPSGQVFGFLGINGAGKTTTLQMLSGDVLPTSGTAMLGGYDIISQQPQVRRLLGYCPQWDALLELLTVREHLDLYARIKGIPEPQVKGVVDAQILQFDLTSFANKTAGSLSGGNKRKLSVAIALIGSPPIVFLDEPSTGMDPVAKRFMWRVISRVATEHKQCSIILTTHSMEEVEALCTRIGIMVGGRLRCLGSSQHLKNRHGQGFVTEVRISEPSIPQIEAFEATVRKAMKYNEPQEGHFISFQQVAAASEALGNPARGAEVKETGTGWKIYAAFLVSSLPHPHSLPHERMITLREFVTWWAEEEAAKVAVMQLCNDYFPGSMLTERHGSKLILRIPPQNESLSKLFARLEAAKGPCRIQSYALSQTSLEQVFNFFAAQQDEEKDVARGMIATTTTTGSVSGGGGLMTPTAPPATTTTMEMVPMKR